MDTIDRKHEDGSGQRRKLLVWALTLCFLLGGVYVVYSGWRYFDIPALYFMFPFFLAVVGFYVSLTTERMVAAFLSMVVGAFCLVMMSNVFTWRQAYIDRGFILEAYVESYPSYLEQQWIKWNDKPDYVSFAKDCLGTKEYPMLRITLPDSCKTIGLIKQHYHVDALRLVHDYYLKMRQTAKHISQGRAEKIKYPFCANTKRCVYIPLPPSNMTEEEILDSTDPDVISMRDGFWDLIEKPSITPDVCMNMLLCNRLVDLGIIGLSEFNLLKKYK